MSSSFCSHHICANLRQVYRTCIALTRHGLPLLLMHSLQQSHETLIPLAPMSSTPCACMYSVHPDARPYMSACRRLLQPAAESSVLCSCTNPSSSVWPEPSHVIL